MTEFEGSVWVVQNEDKVYFVYITERNKNKIQALDEKGNKVRVSEDKLLWQHPTQVRKLEEWPNKLSTIQTAVEMLTREIDVSLLWASAFELQVSEMDDLADLYFGGEITTEHFVAIWQVLAKDRLYFKRRGKVWEARSLEQVEELKIQRRREQLQAQEHALASTWLQQVTKLLQQEDNNEELKILDLAQEVLPFVERLEAWLRGDTDKWVEELVTRIATTMKINPRELVFEILVRIGRLPPNAEREVIVAGLRPEFSTSVLDAAQTVQFWQPSAQQKVIDLLFSIDDEETREVDDALSIEREENQWKIIIAIANPTSVVHRGDVLDREAMRRGTTVYLPTQTILMLPERISCHIASLTAQEIRSSIVVYAWLDDQGKLLKSSICREAIRVLRRLHYSDADELLAQSQEDTAQRLRELLTCAKQLQAQRVTQGAFNLQRSEYKVSIHDGEVNIALIDKDSPSRLLVAEMMILANYIAADYAQRHQVPIIYRTQDPPLEPITQGMLDNPLSFHKVRKLLRASALSLHPSGHSGLGLSVYTQLTSPLRRFADLVMQRQLVDHLSGEALPYDQEELFKVLATAERTAREARMLEGESKRRWFMQYLKQSWGSQPLEVLVIESVKMGYKVEILPWGVETFLGTSKELIPGETVKAMVDKIRVKAGTARLKLV